MKKLRINITDVKAKAGISAIFVVSFLTVPRVGFLPLGTVGFDILNNIMFPLCHANVFHLVCNLLCVWLTRPSYHILSGILISFFASLLPEMTTDPIMGMSGILFAVIGVKYGKMGLLTLLAKRTWAFFVITALLPNVACIYHLYCIIIGYLWGAAIKKRKEVMLWKLTNPC